MLIMITIKIMIMGVRDSKVYSPAKNTYDTFETRRAESTSRWHLTSIGNSIVEIRRSYDRLISTMGFSILVRRHLYIESGPWIQIAELPCEAGILGVFCEFKIWTAFYVHRCTSMYTNNTMLTKDHVTSTLYRYFMQSYATQRWPFWTAKL